MASRPAGFQTDPSLIMDNKRDSMMKMVFLKEQQSQQTKIYEAPLNE